MNKDIGKARISTKPRGPITAGSRITVVYTYTAGHPIDDTGCVKIAFRYAGDFGTPQFDDPAGPDYCSISTTGNCRIEPRWDPKGNTRPWGKALFLKVMGGYLDRGGKITVVFGDRSGGSSGWRAQTFRETTFEFKTLVDPFATYCFKELPRSPLMKIVPGKPAHAVCVAPSVVETGKPFSYNLKLEDRWGNPVRKPRKIRHRGFPRPGLIRITAADSSARLKAKSNPVEVVDSPPPFNHFWADFHGQSEETIGTNTIEEYFRFARDCSFLDIAAHQGNDFQITDEFWRTINSTTTDFYRPDGFVTYPGYEWSGNTPLGGDRNIYFSKEGGNISRSSRDLLPEHKSRFPDSPTAAALFRKLKKSKSPIPFAFAHVGGRYPNMDMHDSSIEHAVEIHSAWGTFEWLLHDALDRGYRVGICANSDDHKGRPGASYPGASRFGSYGGLTCVLARELTREAVLDAVRNRRFYASTGNRPIISLVMAMSGKRQAIMGDIVRAGAQPPTLHAGIAATAPILKVEIFNGRKLLKTIRPYSRAELGNTILLTWSGAEVRGRARMTCWDGSLRLLRNRIAKITPVNFWNPDKPLVRNGKNALRWNSITTGGASGVLLKLERESGTIDLDTAQRRLRVPVNSLGLTPRGWDCGGVAKRIEMCRLPDNHRVCELNFSMTLPELTPGDNPLYVKLTQVDGHMAWTSPVYVIGKGNRK